MSDFAGASVFFDIGDTLASVSLSAEGDRIDRLAMYPFVPGVLGEVKDRGARLGSSPIPVRFAPTRWTARSRRPVSATSSCPC